MAMNEYDSTGNNDRIDEFKDIEILDKIYGLDNDFYNIDEFFITNNVNTLSTSYNNDSFIQPYEKFTSTSSDSTNLEYDEDVNPEKRFKLTTTMLIDNNERMANFPTSFAELINSGNIKLLEQNIFNFFHSNCLIKIRLPTICTVKYGPREVSRLCQVMLSSYPDCSIIIRNLFYHNDTERGVFIMKSKSFFTGTKVNKDIDGYTCVKRAALVDYMNQSKLTNEEKERLLILESTISSKGNLTQRYFKHKMKLIVDNKTGLFVGFDLKVTLSSFREVNLDELEL